MPKMLPAKESKVSTRELCNQLMQQRQWGPLDVAKVLGIHEITVLGWLAGRYPAGNTCQAFMRHLLEEGDEVKS